MDFSEVLREIPILGEICEDLGKPSDDMMAVTNMLYSSLQGWEDLLKDATANKNKFTQDQIDSQIKCNVENPPQVFKPILNSDKHSCDTISAQSSAYLITDILIHKALGSLKTSANQMAYEKLKNYLNTKFGKLEVLNNPQSAAKCLLMWNAISFIRLVEKKQEIYEEKIKAMRSKAQERIKLLESISQAYDKPTQTGGAKPRGRGKPKRKKSKSPKRKKSNGRKRSTSR